VANLHDPDWDGDQDVGPFSWRRAMLGAQAGSERLGASLYELAPGGASFPLHAHHANEEMVVVISGRPTLRTLDGERELSPGEVVACLTGRRGAHRLDNRTDEPARVLVISTKVAPEVVEYPDSGKIGAAAMPPGEQPVRVLVRPEDSLDYFEGEI